jgi:hypothetical protein
MTGGSPVDGYQVDTSTLRQSAQDIDNQCINTWLNDMQQALDGPCVIPAGTFALVDLFMGGLGSSPATSCYDNNLAVTRQYVSTLSGTFSSYVTRLNTTANKYDQADASSAQAAAHAAPPDPGTY